MRFLIALLIAAAPLAAQSSDWAVLRQLSFSDTRVSVLAHRRFSCNFQNVTDDELLCRLPHARRFLTIDGPLRFRRQDVREVRVEDIGRGTLRGALIGSALGAAAGFRGASSDRGTLATIVGLLGGTTGAGIGTNFPVAGEVVYKR